MKQLCVALQLPDVIWTYAGCGVTSLEALAILLRKLAYPARCCDLEVLVEAHLSCV